MNSQRLANQGREAVGGNADSFAAFKATKDQIDSDIKLLNDRYGDAAGVSGPIKTVTATWAPLAKSAEQVTASQQAVLGLAGNADRFTQQVPQLQAQMDEVVRAMSASGSPSSQIYIALREVVLAATMARRVAEIRAGGPGASLAGDALGRDSGVFAQVLAGLRQGDATLNVQKLGNGSAIAALNQATATWTDMKKDLDALLGSSSNLFRAQAAADSLATGSDKLLGDSEKLFAAFTAFGSLRTPASSAACGSASSPAWRCSPRSSACCSRSAARSASATRAPSN